MNRAIAILAVFVATQVVLPRPVLAEEAFPRPVLSGGSESYCRNNFPAVDVTYSAEDIKLVALFDLARCGRELVSLAVMVELSREGIVDGDAAEIEKYCDTSRPTCKLSLAMEHSPIERSHYRADLTYRGHGALRPDGSKKLVRGWWTSEMTCTSAVAFQTCLI